MHLLACLVAVGCTDAPGPPPDAVTGTWGGTDAGLIAGDTAAHVHIGCTVGDARLPIAVNDDGTFEATGTYDVDAFPVPRGILHPARFSGRITGTTMTLTVTLLDTARTLGPVQLTYGVTPQMGPCPICRSPGSMPAGEGWLAPYRRR